MAAERDVEAQKNEAKWDLLWSGLLKKFEEESGDPPEEEPEDWEVQLLLRLLGDAVNRSAVAEVRRRLAKHKPNPTLVVCHRELRTGAERFWSRQAASVHLAAASKHENNHDAFAARQAFLRALELGPEKPWEARLGLAWLATVASRCGGFAEAEKQLRLALDEAAHSGKCPPPLPKKQKKARAVDANGPEREVLTRLCVLLCQHGRESEALPLLRQGGWHHRLARCVLRYPLPKKEGLDAESQQIIFQAYKGKLPLVALDNAIPEDMFQGLREVFAPDALFWKEHRYNSLSRCSSQDVGYFSYAHPLNGEPTNKLDAAIGYIKSLVQPHFPEVKDARFAEWWAHCRPHASGHQMHYDSDNEGIGGARHPICTAVLYLEGAEDLGGPTLVTTQRLKDEILAEHAWLVFPKRGRLAVLDGSVLHGVLPGRGEPTSLEARRVTWMVAFWTDIAIRSFDTDGLPGSSRPLPPTNEPFVLGTREYTWQQKLELETPFCMPSIPATKEDVIPVALPELWEEIAPEGGMRTSSAPAGMPEYNKCFQF